MKTRGTPFKQKEQHHIPGPRNGEWGGWVGRGTRDSTGERGGDKYKICLRLFKLLQHKYIAWAA